MPEPPEPLPLRDRLLAPWRRARAALGRAAAGDAPLRRLAAVAREARDPAEIRLALVRAARDLAGARRAVLLGETPGARGRVLAAWPQDDAPRAGDGATSLEVPLRFAGRRRAALRLSGAGRLSRRQRARLEVLCALAAAAEPGLEACRRGDADPTRDPATSLRTELVLEPFLELALAQARRRGEGLAVLAIAVDHLAAVGEAHGKAIAEAALRRVAQAAVGTLRASDLVARLDDGRLLAVLPGASGSDALMVAEAVRRAIAEAGVTSVTRSPLTASIGVASYPDHADEPDALRAGALAALARLGSRGANRVASADGRSPSASATSSRRRGRHPTPPTVPSDRITASTISLARPR